MIHIGVFFGGTSVEHEVSVITAHQAIAQLKDMEGYTVVPIYISKEGQWYTGEYLMVLEHFKDLTAVCRQSTPIELIRGDRSAVLITAKSSTKKGMRASYKVHEHIDLAFPAIHGTGGEDGKLQGILEHLDIPYVGCDVRAAALTMDKIVTKEVLKASGIPTVAGEWFYAHHWIHNKEVILDAIEEALGYPVIVKPADVGSSIGISTAKNRTQCTEAIDAARLFSQRILVETLLGDMKEVNISVLGDSERFNLSVCESPLSAHELLTYEDKYVTESGSKGMSSAKRELPAQLAPELESEIRRMAANAFLCLGCAGVSRIDFMVDQGSGRPYINEFNTVPGSLAFYLWEASGRSFKEQLSEMIDAAYRAFRRKKALVTTTHINILSQSDLKGIKK